MEEQFVSLAQENRTFAEEVARLASSVAFYEAKLAQVERARAHARTHARRVVWGVDECNASRLLRSLTRI